MNKFYSLLTAAAICSAASGLVASERPFFDQETQKVVKKIAKNYVYGCAGIYGAGTVLATVFATMVHKGWVFIGYDRWTPKQPYIDISRGITRSIVPKVALSFPVVLSFALAQHKHQQIEKA